MNQAAFWQTTPMQPEARQKAVSRAEQQDEAVLAIFRSSNHPLSPSQVWQAGLRQGRQWLLTSVRRSVTNLTTAGALAHLPTTRQGPYGRPEGIWMLREWLA